MRKPVAVDRWTKVRTLARRSQLGAGLRPGITLTEILISIMILGVGLVSLATLFPIGLLRLRDAARWSRSATLLQTAASDAVARGLFSSQSFAQADYYNYLINPNGPFWYHDSNGVLFNPLVQDTASYLGAAYTVGQNNVITGYVGAYANPFLTAPVGAVSGDASFPGLPFAYDPLWRYFTVNPSNPQANGSNYPSGGYYIADPGAYEARFGYGLPNLRTDPSGGTPSAYGLQRITNFNRPLIMPAALYVPNIFVSQEDMVWQDPNVNTYTLEGIALKNGGQLITSPNPVIPDISPSVAQAEQGINGGTPSLDWRYTWMFTGQLSSAGNASTFDGNIVIFENRPFGIGPPTNTSPNVAQGGPLDYQVDGEIVVEGVFGYSGNVIGAGGLGAGGVGYGASADRTVLLRWPTSMPDPVVRPGDWIADVTYERNQAVVQTRFLNGGTGGLSNWANKGEWDNLPAQRCFWYQVQKSTPPVPDLLVAGTRSMVVYVNQNLQARTVLNNNGTPAYLNAALIAPNVINVIPQTIFVR